MPRGMPVSPWQGPSSVPPLWKPAVQTAKMIVTPKGFEPSALTFRAGVPVRITVVRTTDETCAKEIVIPAFDLKRALPLNAAVNIEFTPEKAGELKFLCGMEMLHGTITVK